MYGTARNVEPAAVRVGVDIVPASLPADPHCFEDLIWTVLLRYGEWRARGHCCGDYNGYRTHEGVSEKKYSSQKLKAGLRPGELQPLSEVWRGLQRVPGL